MLKLVKTVGGSSNLPNVCTHCGNTHFLRTKIAWNCSRCGSYVPINFGVYGTEKLQKDLEVLSVLHKEFKKAIDDLERIVKK